MLSQSQSLILKSMPDFKRKSEFSKFQQHLAACAHGHGVSDCCASSIPRGLQTTQAQISPKLFICRPVVSPLALIPCKDFQDSQDFTRESSAQSSLPSPTLRICGRRLTRRRSPQASGAGHAYSTVNSGGRVSLAKRDTDRHMECFKDKRC